MSDGQDRWLIAVALIVVLIIMVAVGVGVIIFCIRRRGRKSSKKSLQDDPDMPMIVRKPTKAKASSSLTDVSTNDSIASTEKRSKPAPKSKKLDEDGSSGPLHAVKAMQSATTLSEGGPACVEQPTEALEMQPHYTAEEDIPTVIDLGGQKEPSSGSQASTSDRTPEAEQLMEVIQPTEEPDKEKTEHLLGEQVPERSSSPSQESTTDPTLRAENSSETDQPEEGETDRLL